MSLVCRLYLFSQRFKFVRPGLEVSQSITDLPGLLSHASGSVPDGAQSVVSQLLDLDVQRCQVGTALQIRCWEAEEEHRKKKKHSELLNPLLYFFLYLVKLFFFFPDSPGFIGFLLHKKENRKEHTYIHTISSTYLSKSSIS